MAQTQTAEKTKVLIVDDEPINLDFFDVMLSKLGFVVERAEDGAEALERVCEFDPDLIILDNVMPKMSGWQVTKILKHDERYSRYHHVPIIMFSAMDDVKDKIEGFELGIEDYITKPFNFSEVLARIRAVLRGKELYRELKSKEEENEYLSEQCSSFVQTLKMIESPLKKIVELGPAIEHAGQKELQDYAGLTRQEAAVLLDLVGEKITAYEKQPSVEAIGGDAVLRSLDKRFHTHFKRLKENADTMGEVKQ